MPSSTPKIAIIGAGPASLTLGSILQRHSIPFTIFETAGEIRLQGGTLDLHPHTGQLALKESGLWDEFVKHARPESDVNKIVTLDGEVLWDENTTDKQDIAPGTELDGRPEIDRMKLTMMLFEALAEGSVVFGKKLDNVVPCVTNTNNAPSYDLHFANGDKELEFDLVIGGDGAWSKVRKLLSKQTPEYSGISMVEFWCHDIKSNGWLVDYVGEGSMMAFGEGCAVQAQRQGDGGLRTYGSLRVPEDFLDTCGIDWADAGTACKEYVGRYFSHVHADLKRVMLESTDRVTARPLFELPVGFRWEFMSGVTLIGDAAHLFTPFAGEGVNVGMMDALVLGREIAKVCKGEQDLDQGIKAYEQEMYPRSARAAAKTERGKKKHFSADGAKEFAGMFTAHYYHHQQNVGL